MHIVNFLLLSKYIIQNAMYNIVSPNPPAKQFPIHIRFHNDNLTGIDHRFPMTEDPLQINKTIELLEEQYEKLQQLRFLESANRSLLEKIDLAKEIENARGKRFKPKNKDIGTFWETYEDMFF